MSGSILHRDRTVAGAGFNRWLVPPAALCIHLCIGQAYAFSVFNLPLTKLIGITASAPGDWKLTEVTLIFIIAIVFLGLSAAVFGRWVEEGGPRKAMFTSALCFGGGFLVAAAGAYLHNKWVLYGGYGVLGGIGLGIGYISPVSTLIKWFPDRPGMATGMAIMGFGGGAMIASPLSVFLMSRFSTPTHIGVAETFVCLGVIYALFMLIGAAIVRVPPANWQPAGWKPPVTTGKLVTTANVHVYDALKTPQFWLLWAVLCLNVTAGISVISQASNMIQEMFPGKVSVAAAAGFVGLISIFNMGGRFFWASISDLIGRKATYVCFFVLGAALFAVLPRTAAMGNVPFFLGCCMIIATMYGGGFATIPAYLRDLFGTQYVGAIHGWCITAWSAAGFGGPYLISFLREYQIDQGLPKAEAYNFTLYVMAALLVFGLLCNLLVTAVDSRYHIVTRPATARRAAA